MASIDENIYNLGEFTMIAGTLQEIQFDPKDEDGIAIDISSAQSTGARFSRVGFEEVLFEKAGVIETVNSFVITLEGTDTENLAGGKYRYQPFIIDNDGNPFWNAQGKILIINQIK